ncbi:hypothetical protein [Actinoplanes sp. NPDC051411]|uniref:hypothetical protein n=1 Tax=Actinoplanes sp. NPDC051411 TaxID=3155522 RepID=UPI0034496CAF
MAGVAAAAEGGAGGGRPGGRRERVAGQQGGLGAYLEGVGPGVVLALGRGLGQGGGQAAVGLAEQAGGDQGAGAFDVDDGHPARHDRLVDRADRREGAEGRREVARHVLEAAQVHLGHGRHHRQVVPAGQGQGAAEVFPGGRHAAGVEAEQCAVVQGLDQVERVGQAGYGAVELGGGPVGASVAAQQDRALGVQQRKSGRR